MTPRLSPPPAAGEGVHAWLFRAARVFRWYGASPEQAAAQLREVVGGVGRTVPDREIRDAVVNASRFPWHERDGRSSGFASVRRGDWPTAQPRSPTRPKRDPQLIARIVREGIGEADLWERSPCRFDDPQPPRFWLEQLFRPGELICLGPSVEQAFTWDREEWLESDDLATMRFVVPSAMQSEVGTTSSGRLSYRARDSVGPRRFLVAEFDSGTRDEQAALHWHLQQFVPLALAVYSGGKSLHGWYRIEGLADDDVKRFSNHAIELGADPASMTPNQFVRFPDAVRDNCVRQDVVYFNPVIINSQEEKGVRKTRPGMESGSGLKLE